MSGIPSKDASFVWGTPRNYALTSYKLKIDRGKVTFENYDEIFSGETIGKIINFVNSVHKKYKGINVPLVFSFGTIQLADKLCYILFECICYALINNYHHKVYLYWDPDFNILTDGVFSSPLKLLNENNDKGIANQTRFLSRFNMELKLPIPQMGLVP